MKIKNKIFLLNLLILAFLMSIGACLTFRLSSKSIKEQVYKHLTTVAKTKAIWLNTYIRGKKGDLAILAVSPFVKNSLKAGSFHFNGASESEIESRKQYLKRVTESYGFYDLFLISIDGNIWWTAEEESDLGTSLVTGPYKDTSLAKVYRHAKSSEEVTISDFQYYLPRSGEPAAFIASPVYYNNIIVGVLATQLSTARINEIMQDRTGLGQTGETYLVGKDYLMRSDSRFFEESTILKQRVDTANARDCFEFEASGKTHPWLETVREFPDYRGVEVLGTHIYIPDVQWALLAEIDSKEAFAPLRYLLWIFITIGFAGIVFAFVISNWLSKKITDPIIKLKDKAALIGSGQLDTPIDIQSNDEIGELAESFGKMTKGLKESTTSINRLNTEIAERKRAEEALQESEERFRKAVVNSPFPIMIHADDGEVFQINDVWTELTGYLPEEIPTLSEWTERAYGEKKDIVKSRINKIFDCDTRVEEGEYIITAKDGSTLIWDFSSAPLATLSDGRRVVISTAMDITERKRTEEDLKRIEWLISSKSEDEFSELDHTQSYGDLTELNSCRILLDGVGKDTLQDIVKDYVNLLGTSSAIYEKTGEYALGIFASGWCRALDEASRALCRTQNDKEALESGHWHCHESCWSDTAKVSIETGEPADIECKGGLHLYAVPIFAGDEIVGSINFGYGDPPKSPEKLKEIADAYGLDEELLLKLSNEYRTRPAFIIDIAKDRLKTSAKLIGAIVERTRAEKAVRDSEARLRSLRDDVLDNSGMGLFILDADFKVAWINRTIEVFFGLQREQVIGKVKRKLIRATISDIFEDPQEFMDKVFSTYDDNTYLEQFECHVLGGVNRQDRWLEHRSLPILSGFYAGGRMEHYIDITERKRSEEALKDKTREMEALLRAVSHDLRSPLVNIDGFSGELASDCQHLAELMQAVKADGETKKEIETLAGKYIPESVSFIRKGTKKMDDLLKGLSHLAKAGTVQLDIQRLDVNEIIQSIVDTMKFSARKAGTAIELETLPDCLGDEVQINQIFSNLIGNAIKYLDPQRPGRIRIWGKVEGNMAQYCVEDNGVGIPDYHKAKVFDVFHRVDPKNPASGDGLGLTTTKQIVERHKGRIWLESEQDKGSKFFVAIPI